MGVPLGSSICMKLWRQGGGRLLINFHFSLTINLILVVSLFRKLPRSRCMRAPNTTPALVQEWAVWSRTTWTLRHEHDDNFNIKICIVECRKGTQTSQCYNHRLIHRPTLCRNHRLLIPDNSMSKSLVKHLNYLGKLLTPSAVLSHSGISPIRVFASDTCSGASRPLWRSAARERGRRQRHKRPDCERSSGTRTNCSDPLERWTTFRNQTECDHISG